MTLNQSSGMTISLSLKPGYTVGNPLQLPFSKMKQAQMNCTRICDFCIVSPLTFNMGFSAVADVPPFLHTRPLFFA